MDKQALLQHLNTKGAKCNLQFSKQTMDIFERECGFTDEEWEILQMRGRGWSIIRISNEMYTRHDEYYSISRIEARIRSIKNKIAEVLSQG